MDVPDTTAQPVVETEGDPAFPTPGPENDNSADSPSGEQTTEDPTQPDGGVENPNEKKPETEDDGIDNLADHPRWKQREDDWKDRFNDQESRHQEDMQKLRDSLLSEFEERYGKKGEAADTSDAAPDEPPAWFGGDAKAWAEFLSWNKQQLESVQGKAVEAVTEREQKEKNAIKEATEFMESEVAAIEKDQKLNPSGDPIDKQKLLQTALDNELMDTKGRWNYRAAARLMLQQAEQPKPEEAKKPDTGPKKKIAAATTEGQQADPAIPDVTTSEDFSKPGNRPW